MKRTVLLLSVLAWGLGVFSYNDPMIMTINGVPIHYSEFEYYCNKNKVCDVKEGENLKDLLDLFTNYKLEIIAANDAHIDTTSIFKRDLLCFNNSSTVSSNVFNISILDKAHEIYNDEYSKVGSQGTVHIAQILLRLNQRASNETESRLKIRIDSIYDALSNGADFSVMAKKYSENKYAMQGGLLPWIYIGQTLPEFEDCAYSLKEGEISKPFLSPAGYNIIKVIEKKELEPFDNLKEYIIKSLEKRELCDGVVNAENPTFVEDKSLYNESQSSIQNNGQSVKIMNDFYNEFLITEMTKKILNETAYDKSDLISYFNKNRKNYKWFSPRYKGIVYHVKTKSDAKSVNRMLRSVPSEKWEYTIQNSFNTDSVIRVKIEKGIYKQGDNKYVDEIIFHKNIKNNDLHEYPITAVYGKKLKKGPDTFEDVEDLVLVDYQDYIYKQWINELHKKYKVVINKEILETVNNHRK